MRCPKLLQGLSLEPQSGGYIVKGGRATVRLPAHAVAILLLCDGEQAAAGIARALEHRVAPHVIAKLTDQLGDLGLLEHVERELPLTTLDDAPVLHHCHSCGGSCEGSMVGPLPESRVASLRTLHAELAEQYPRVAAHEPVVHRVMTTGERIPFLNFPEKHCVFLADDKLCLIHRHYGMDAKPDICRRFPVIAVEAEGTVRVGIRPMCFRNHRDMSPAEPSPLAEKARDAPERSPALLPPPGSPPFAEAFEESVADETRFLAWLSEPEMTLEELIARVAEQPPASPPRRALSSAFYTALDPILATLAQRFDAQLDEAPVTLFGRRLRELIAVLPALPEARPGSVEMPEAWRAFVLESLRRAVFLREFEHFPSVALGVFTLAVGGLIAFWTHRDERTEHAVDDLFAEKLVAWTRVMCQPERFFEMFDDPEQVDAVLSTLR